MLPLLAAGLPAPAGGAFTTRAGGVSAEPYDALNLGMHVDDEWRRVHANRSLLASAVGLAPEDLLFDASPHGPALQRRSFALRKDVSVLSRPAGARSAT